MGMDVSIGVKVGGVVFIIFLIFEFFGNYWIKDGDYQDRVNPEL